MSNIPNMKDLLEKAKKMQTNIKKAQDEISNIEATGSAGGDLVKVTINGAHQATKVQLSEDLMKEGKEMIEDLITAAINDAEQKIESATKEKMMSVTSGMDIPTDKLNFL